MMEMKTIGRSGADHVTQDGGSAEEQFTQDDEERTDEALSYLAAGAAPHSAKRDVHRAVATRSYRALSALLSAGATKNAPDQQGWTPLAQAVGLQWTEGVRLLLDAKADVIARTPVKSVPTVLHLAASLESTEILELLLSQPDVGQIVNEVNCDGETPLLVVISNRKLAAHGGSDQIVDRLLKAGCDPRARVEYDKHSGFTALHMAVYSNRVSVVKVLLEHKDSLGGRKKEEIEDLVDLVDLVTADGWMPVHIACLFGLEECARLLLLAGSDLSATIKRPDGELASCMNILLFSMPFSLDFLCHTLDSCISFQEIQSDNGGVKRCIEIDFTILSPKRIKLFQHMNVVDALLQAGNQLNQQHLFLHPLIESYLYLEWKKVCIFYCFLLGAYISFCLGFSIHVIGVFHLREMLLYPWLSFVSRFLAITVCVVLYYEVMLTMLAGFEMCKQCRCGQMITFLKHLTIFCVYFLKLAWFSTLPIFMYLEPNNMSFPREVATLSLLLCWFRIMFLISRVPRYGFYLLMFFEVSFNFFKVFASFSGIIAVFVTTFTLEFGSMSPFNSTSNSIIKTIVMMSSEFDHSDLLQNLKDEGYISALFKGFLFIIFVLLVAIVIMNILVAKAIKDVKEIDRIRKQAEFLCRLEKVIELTRLCCTKVKQIKPFTLCPCVISRAKNKKVVISIDENLKGGVKLHQKLHLRILEIAHKNKLSKTY